jgi:hypothetical protein
MQFIIFEFSISKVGQRSSRPLFSYCFLPLNEFQCDRYAWGVPNVQDVERCKESLQGIHETPDIIIDHFLVNDKKEALGHKGIGP